MNERRDTVLGRRFFLLHTSIAVWSSRHVFTMESSSTSVRGFPAIRCAPIGLVAVINLFTGFCTLNLLSIAIPSSSISWRVLGINESCSLYTRKRMR